MPRHGKLLRDSNDWTENPPIDPENHLGELILGLHFERPHWELHFTVHLATDSVDPETGPELEDHCNDFGILVAEWKF